MLKTYIKLLLEEYQEEEDIYELPYNKILVLDTSSPLRNNQSLKKDIYNLIGKAYDMVNGHGSVGSANKLDEYDYWIIADTDKDNKPNVALMAGKTNNGSIKVSVFATDSSAGAKSLLMNSIKEVLTKDNWWAEIPYQFASFLHSRGVPMIETMETVVLLLGRRILNPSSNFEWYGSEVPSKSLSGSGYYKRNFFGKDDIRAILGNVPESHIEKIKDYINNRKNF